MTTTIITQNPIPNGGVINISYSDTLTNTGGDECYTVHPSASCEIDSGGKSVVITISDTAGVDAGSFSFYTLNQFDVSTSTASITTATSKVSSSGENIDTTAEAFTIALATTGVQEMTSYTFFGVDDDGDGDGVASIQTTGSEHKSILVTA